MKYYKLSGALRDKVLAVIADRVAAHVEIEKFVKRIGGKTWYLVGGKTWYLGSFFDNRVVGIGFKPEVTPDVKLWKNAKHSDCIWMPRRSNKEGRALCEEMGKFRVPGGYEVGKIIGMETFSGMSWRCPGVEEFGKPPIVVVSVPDDFTLNKKEACRISDLEVEQYRTLNKKKGK